MVRVVKTGLRLSLKLVNSTLGLAGIAMILYSIWLSRVWQRNASTDHYNSTFPWFIHASLGIGITLCAITCLGHVAADTANAYCLSSYMGMIVMLLLLETAIIADICLNYDWEKDFPEVPSGMFNDFKDFVSSNMGICKWMSMLMFLVQGLSILLSTALRTLATDKRTSYETDGDYTTPRLPLLDHPDPPLPYVINEVHMDPYFTTRPGR